MLTFNLLPLQKQAELNSQKILKRILTYAKTFVGLLFVLSLFMLFTLIFLSRQKALLETKIQTKEADPYIQVIQAVQKEIKIFNEELKKLSLSIDKKKWSSFLIALSSLTPQEITIEKISYQTTKGKEGFVINGYSPTRENLIAFESKLKESPFFKNVLLPLSNLRKTQDISFLITIEIK